MGALRRLLLCFVALLLPSCGNEPSLRIAVLLPVTKTAPRQAIEWAAENINAAGGVEGAKVEIDFSDLTPSDATTAAAAQIGDPTISAVIGTHESQSTLDIAQMFIDAKKPLVSPAASSADFFRMYEGQHHFLWRTVQGDVAQAKILAQVANRAGANRVAVMASHDSYGDTLFDWIGYFATELGLATTAVIQVDTTVEACGARVNKLLAGDPDLVVIAMQNLSDIECVVKAVRQQSAETRLLVSSSGFDPQLISDLEGVAEGIEGTTLASDPKFADAWRSRFGESPGPFAAEAYDAVLLLAYGYVRANGTGGDALAGALVDVASGSGPVVGWDGAGIRDALGAIRGGSLPTILGAAGPLRFDPDAFMERASSTYSHWRIAGGQFTVVENLITTPGHALELSTGSDSLLEDLADDTPESIPSHGGSWALIAALSKTWKNYRHEADALAQYQLLKSNGWSDDRIVLVYEGDIATDPLNRNPGVVRNAVGGPNLNVELQVDYPLHALDATDLLNILAGRKTDTTPIVLESTASDDVYVFLVGHGDETGLLMQGRPDANVPTRIGADDVAKTVSEMAAAGRYRHLFFVTEACHAGLLGTKLSAPRALFLAGANAAEDSFGANYDPSLRVWLADEFAYQLFLAETTNPETPMADLYRNLYHQVSGSHVSIYNQAAFPSLHSTSLVTFVRP